MLEHFTALDLVRISIFTIFGSIISYYDIKEKKIYNKHLLVMFILGLVLFFAGLKFFLIPVFLINFFLSLFFGFLFWKMKIWKPGDAKLFSICSIYLPFKFYSSFITSQIILTNLFLVAFFVWVIPVLIRTDKNAKKKSIKQVFNIKNIFEVFLTIFGLFYFIGQFFTLFDLNLMYEFGYFITLLFTFFLFVLIKKILPDKTFYFLLFLTIIRFFVDPSIFEINFWLDSFLSMMVILIASWIGEIAYYISYEKKKVSNLEEGDIPVGFVTEGKRLRDFEKFIEQNFDNKERILEDGLNDKEIGKINNFERIKFMFVKEYISFAPWLILSTILASVLGTDIFLFFISQIYRRFYE